jgi:hypothetical protein
MMRPPFIVGLLSALALIAQTAAAQLFVPSITGLTGDCTASGPNVVPITCTKTNGVTFSPSATLDATNASNISSGTLSNGRLASGAAVANLGYVPLSPANNLADLSSVPTALSNLGIGPLGTQAGSSPAIAVGLALGYTPVNPATQGPLSTQAGATGSAAINAALGYMPVNPSSLGPLATQGGASGSAAIAAALGFTPANAASQGSMAAQNANAVAITGGAISGVSASIAGHLTLTGSAPTISGCGTGAAVTGNDSVWALTTGASLGTCTLTFANAWAVAPSCVVTSNNVTSLAIVGSVSTSSLTLSLTSIIASATIRGICVQA